MRLASLPINTKFILACNGKRYIRYAYVYTDGCVYPRIIVKPVNHGVSPLVQKDTSQLTFSPNCKIYKDLVC